MPLHGLDAGIGFRQLGDQRLERFPLSRRAGVLRRETAVIGDAADIADPDGAGIVAAHMSAGLPDRPSLVHLAVEVDDIVIADVAPSPIGMPLADDLNRDRPPFRRGGAVDDDGVNRPHVSLLKQKQPANRRPSGTKKAADKAAHRGR